MTTMRARARRAKPIVLADDMLDADLVGVPATAADGSAPEFVGDGGETSHGRSTPGGRRNGKLGLFDCPACKRQFWAPKSRSLTCAWCGADQHKAARAANGAANGSIAQNSVISHETLVRVLAASWQNNPITSAPFPDVDERLAVRRGVVIAGLVLLVLVLGGALGLE